MMSFNPGGILSKLESNADKLGLLYGYLQPMTTVPGAAGDPLKGIIQEHTQLITNFRIPTLDLLKEHFESYTKGAFSLALIAYIGGYVVDLFSSRIGDVLKDAGVGIAKGAALSTAVMSMGGGSSSGSTPVGGNIY